MQENTLSQVTPLIFDDDGSQDGMTALAYMLENPKFDLQAITISQGIARPKIFADNLAKMLTRTEDTDIPIGVGRSTPLEGNNEFPDFIRDGSDTFWAPFVTLPDEADPSVEIRDDAVDLIIETINNSPEPVAILATGPLTNIAEALRRDPSIVDNIEIVQVMGGAVFVEGNLPVLPFPPFSTNLEGEFNIWVDPVAAQEVFDFSEQGLKIQLTPLDATSQVEFDRDDYQAWLETGTPESEIAAEFLDFALEVIQSDLDPNPVWDLVAAINLSEPDFSPETPLHIDVDIESDPGDSQGKTEAVDGLPANVLVSLNPSFDNLDFDTSEVFSALLEASLTTVSLTADRTVIVEGGDPQLLTFTLSQPAPAGGLVVNLRVDDPDGESGPGDTGFPPELISNIVEFGQVEENGVITASLTIAEGATMATFGIAAFEDDEPEGDETYSLTLLADENYSVDTDNQVVDTIIREANKPNLITVGISPEAVTATEGETFAWNFTLDQSAPAVGLSLFLPITVNDDPAFGDVDYFVEGTNTANFELVTLFDDAVSQIFAFGDSYSEDGRSLELSTEAVNAGVPDAFILPADPDLGLYDPEGRWTNGPTAVEVLSETLEVDLTNYAVGGAKSGNGNYYSWLNTVQDTGVLGQIEEFEADLSGQAADPDALYFIFASANDLFEFTDFGLPGTVEELAADTVENIVESVSDLSALGAEQFLVVNSSDLDILPGVIEFGQVAEAALFTDEVNALLPGALAMLRQDLEVEIALYDHVAISDEIRANPEEFGLTNVDDPYQPVFPVEPVAGPDPDAFYFWDEYHPTRRVHEIIGEDMAALVESEIADSGSTVGFAVTIAEGATEATLVSEVVADGIAEGDETFTTVLADGSNYRADPANNQVVTTLLDVTVNESLIDLTGFDGEVALNVTVERDAGFNNVVRFYQTDANGQVDDLLPGEAGYEDAVLDNLTEGFGISVENNKSMINLTLTLAGGSFYAPALLVNGKPEKGLVTIDDAAMGMSMIQRDGSVFKFEDFTDFDFNDIVLMLNSTEAIA